MLATVTAVETAAEATPVYFEDNEGSAEQHR